MSWRAGVAGLGVGAVLLMAVAGCSGDEADSGSPSPAASVPNPIVVQAYGSAQEQLLANIYAGALTAGGVFAEVAPESKRSSAIAAVQESEVDVVIDTVGGLTRYLSRNQTDPAGSVVVSPDLETAMSTLRDLANPVELAIPNPASASDAPVVAIGEPLSTGRSIATLSQLGAFSQERPIAMGGLLACDSPSPCLQRWITGYDLQVADYSSTESGDQTRKGIRAADFVAGVFADSDGALANQDVVVLQDNEQVTPVDNVVPVVSATSAMPAVTDVLNRVSAALDSPALRDLNLSVSAGGTPAEIADAWLAVNGLA